MPVYRRPPRHRSDWAVEGADGREPRVIKSLHLRPEELETHNRHLQAKFAAIVEREARWAGDRLDDAELVIVAYGTAARVARTAIERAREAGLTVGLFRPVSLWPFPSTALAELAERARGILVLELSAGQLVEDVRLAVEGRAPVVHHGRTGGMVPSPTEVVTALRHLYAITTPRAPTASEKPDEPDPLSLVEEGEWERFRWRCHAKDRLEPLVEHVASPPVAPLGSRP